ncbi:hypothetical protein K440DRAFT_620352 [Wilcoxina mikolae CBS 423.85]|nr:hypothetical protein K440DRAFT_620352 [Wilcoxina mikolae CBS 423.85]
MTAAAPATITFSAPDVEVETEAAAASVVVWAALLEIVPVDAVPVSEEAALVTSARIPAIALENCGTSVAPPTLLVILAMNSLFALVPVGMALLTAAKKLLCSGAPVGTTPARSEAPMLLSAELVGNGSWGIVSLGGRGERGRGETNVGAEETVDYVFGRGLWILLFLSITEEGGGGIGGNILIYRPEDVLWLVVAVAVEVWIVVAVRLRIYKA